MNNQEWKNLLDPADRSILDKKIRTLAEIGKIAKKIADKKKKERTFVRKTAHKILGSQETAINLKKDMDEEIALRKNASDPLERISVFAHALLVLIECEELNSMNNPVYKQAYLQYEVGYIQEVQKFVDMQYKEDFNNVLINHLENALEVLVEKKNSEAVKRLKEIPNYKKLLDSYKQLKMKFDSLLKNFNKEDLKECIQLLCILQNNDLSQKVAKDLVNSLQKLYQKISLELVNNIIFEQNQVAPSIQAIISSIDKYLDIRNAFGVSGIDLGSEEYSAKRDDLKNLSIELLEVNKNIEEELKSISSESASSENKLVNYLKFERELEQYLKKFAYPFVESQKQIMRIKDIQQQIQEKSLQMRKQFLAPFKEKMKLNASLILKEQLFLWNNLEKKINNEVDLLAKQGINLLELNDLLPELEATRLNFIKNKLQELQINKDKFCEYQEALTLLAQELSPSDIETSGIASELKKVVEFGQEIETAQQYMNKLKSVEVEDFKPYDFYSEISFLEKFITNNRTSKFIICSDIKAIFTDIVEYYKSLLIISTEFYQKNAWKGNLILQKPGTQVKIILLDKAQLQIGRADKSGQLITGNRLSLPWNRISGEHFLIDFQQAFLKDLNSSNGTYINKLPQKITSESLASVKEFNLACDLTFKLVYDPKNYSVFNFSSFSTNFDNTPVFITKQALEDKLRDSFFVYLPTDQANSKLFIRKYNGMIVMDSEVLDKDDCYIIERDQDSFYYTDTKENIYKQPIQKENNNFMTLVVTNLMI